MAVAAQVAGAQEHATNDEKCSKLGWACESLAVESYGAWGQSSPALHQHLNFQINYSAERFS